jgi:uncharacterized protein (UPF0332 family)
MSFDRYRVQKAIELDIGCIDITKWNSYLPKFKAYKITESNCEGLLLQLKKDAADTYFKAIFSLADAINGLHQGRHSWSVIKIYYSVFFFLRCSLATSKYVFLKNKGIYALKLSKGESPERKDLGTYAGERISGDHKTTIVTYISFFKDTDILQSNTIEGMNFYEWIMELRNQVNYREREFAEPCNRYFYDAVFDKNKIKSQVEIYLKDEDYIYCFDKEHCSLAAPLKLALAVREQLFNFIDFEPISQNKKMEIEKLVEGAGLHKLEIFKLLYNFGRV